MWRDIFDVDGWNDHHHIASHFCVAAITTHNPKNFCLPLTRKVNCLYEIYAHFLREVAATDRKN